MKTTQRLAASALGLAISLSGLIQRAHAQDLPRFSSLQRLSNAEYRLRLDASNGLDFRIEVSSNLFDWTSLLTLRSTGANFHTDSATPYLDRRFYLARELAGTNHLTGDHLVTSAGDVVIHPINHATFVMSWNGRMIHVDPVGGGTPFANMPKADLVLVTHSHGDHSSATTLAAVLGPGGTILAPQAVYNTLSDVLKASTKVMGNGAVTNLLGLRVEAVPAYSSYHSIGAGNGYVLTIGDRRLYISGDTQDTVEIRALTAIDLAFVCMNTPYTMTVSDAAAAVRAFRPRVVYPYHYRNEGGTFSDVNAFKAQVGADWGIEVRLRPWYP